MKIVTLQSVSAARLKIAAFGKITYSVTCIVALLKRGLGYRHWVTVIGLPSQVSPLSVKPTAMRAKPTPPMKKERYNMKDIKTKRVTFRVTEEEYKQLEELAYGSYRLISVYCRDCVFGKKITVIPGVDDASKQLRHIGNNLNQLTWRVNEGTLTAVNLEETKYELAKIFELLNEKMKGA